MKPSTQKMLVTGILMVTILYILVSLEHIRLLSHLAYDVTSSIVFTVDMVLLLFAAYQLLISLAGFIPRRTLRTEEPKTRFLCITAAHNEREVIYEHVKNMLAIDYPEELFDVVVLADNCKDETAALAEDAGAIVWERFSTTEKGKGYALKWAIHHKADLSEYDAVCIFDADNLVDLNFLRVMNKYISKGYVAVQAYLDTKNPWDSWVSTSYAASYWFMNRFWQRARASVGLSGALGGTGFAVSSKWLQHHPWEAMSLTEDLEYTIRVILQNERVYWTDECRVYDEKPTSLAPTFPQRTRWLQGHWSVALDYSASLLKLVLTCRGGKSARALDALIYLWQPMLILLTGINLLFTVMQIGLGSHWYAHWLADILPFPIWSAMLAISLFMPLIAYALEDAGWRAFWRFPMFLVFNLTWIPIALRGFFQRRETVWVHTQHSRALTFSEMAIARKESES